ncbi:MAG: FliA/WhiG family RNA polymerase sigma factor [Lachnospiraceae bacterium]|nr:FliA/WhiG family RNA polymerase sigma factor [Lachnospiraceae bacterium]
MDESARQKLWDSYLKSPTSETREKIILEYAPLVKIVAGRLAMYLGYNVEYEDLVSYGIFGLIDAIDRFDAGKDVKFETYASLRIRGSILDQIRKMDWIPRTVRKRQRDIQTAIKNIEARTGRAATDEDIAVELGITSSEYDEWQSQMKVTNIISLDEFVEQGGGDINVSEPQSTISRFDLPEEAIAREELKLKLKEALNDLTEKEQKVILLYYYEDLTLKEISNVLEVSESRVSQLHTKALNKMKGKMGPYMEILSGNM